MEMRPKVCKPLLPLKFLLKFEREDIDLNLQKGSILILTLLMLIAMTAIGVAVFDIISVSQKIASNVQNNMNAELAHDTVRAQVIKSIRSSTTAYTGYNTLQAIAPQDQTAAWWAANGSTIGVTVPNVASQPQYYIERFYCDNTSQSAYYRVTVRSVGATAAVTRVTTSFVESKAPKPWISGTFFDVSNPGCQSTNYAAYAFTLSSTVYPSINGFISVLWFPACWYWWSPGYAQNVPFTVTLSAPGFPTYVEQFPAAWTQNWYGTTGAVILTVPYYVVRFSQVTITVNNMSCPNVWGAPNAYIGCWPDKLYVQAMGYPDLCP